MATVHDLRRLRSFALRCFFSFRFGSDVSWLPGVSLFVYKRLVSSPRLIDVTSEINVGNTTRCFDKYTPISHHRGSPNMKFGFNDSNQICSTRPPTVGIAEGVLPGLVHYSYDRLHAPTTVLFLYLYYKLACILPVGVYLSRVVP
jgi:hypothetical protein